MLDSEEYSFRYDCGLTLPGTSITSYHFKFKDDLINFLITHFAVVCG